MAATAAMPSSQLALLFLLLISPTFSLAASSSACAGEKFPAGRKYANCEDLPQLGAALHWTYDDSTAALSLAFVAAPAKPGGWVAWGLNPTGSGMTGAQALVALKPSSSAPVAVKTYNITGYVPLGGASTPLAFPATELAADESGAGGSKIRVYGKLQLRKGTKEVNQVWQVGSSVTNGAPDKHDIGAGNLAAKATLVLAGSSGKAAAAAPAPAPTAGGGPDAGEGVGTVTAPPAGTKTPSASAAALATATAGVDKLALLVLALAAAFFLA